MNKEPLFPATGKIYLLTVGEYDDFDVQGVASTPEQAKKFMDQFPDEEWNKLKEMMIDDFIKIPKGKYPYFVRIKKDKTCAIETQRCPLDIYHASLINKEVVVDCKMDLMVYVWAETSEEAERLALKKVSE